MLTQAIVHVSKSVKYVIQYRLRVVPHFSSVSPFLAWGDFHAPSRFARSTIPEEKWGTTRGLDTVASDLRTQSRRNNLL